MNDDDCTHPCDRSYSPPGCFCREPASDHLREQDIQRERFFRTMRRHIRAEDARLTDDGFVRAVLNRYLADRGLPLIDPNE